MSRKIRSADASAIELKLKSELDRTRRELARLKKGAAASAAAPAPELEPDSEALTALQAKNDELEKTKQRLSRLYFTQLDENRKRAERLHLILRIIGDINADLDLDRLMQRIAATIQHSLGFRIVLIRVREPGTNRLRARAFAGLADGARAALESEDVLLEDFRSWLKDEFRVSQSYFISHKHSFSKILPPGCVADLGRRQEWEWNEQDVLLVPLMNGSGDLVGYYSVDDPVDRLVPSREAIELLEIFGHHAVVAIENARLYHELESHTRELEETGQRLQEMNALKTNFVSTISHELRTPLTAIRACVDTLMLAGEHRQPVPPEQLERFLAIINDESQRLTRLIESVLDLSRLGAGNLQGRKQVVNLTEVLDEAAAVLEPTAQAGQVNLKVVNDLADTEIEADRDQIRQLVLHLGSNAVKFTPHGGSVTFRLGGDAHEVTMLVEDTGIGIPEPALEKIFERFYQVDSSLVRRFGGTGLGLSICRSIVEWHGGRVFASSHPGEGSCFTVRLPRRAGPRAIVRPGLQPEAGVEDVLKLAVEMVAEVMNARVVSLMSCEADGDLVIQAAQGLEERIVREARLKPGHGVAGWVAQHRRPLCVSRTEDAGDVGHSGRPQYRSGTFISVPLEGRERLLGVLNVTDPLAHESFDAEACHMLLDLAERIATAWERSRRHEVSQEELEDTASSLRQLLQHVKRSRTIAPDRARLAQALARELDLADDAVGAVRFAATVHDIGMTMLGEHLLARPGSLSPTEREEMKRHAELGADLLRPLETMGAVRDVVISHHEWWDGTGYPRGLQGPEIPIGARILAVVDAFESMTLGRPYRPSQPPAEALAEIQRLSGRQFDPEVVAAFERVLTRMDNVHPAESLSEPPAAHVRR
ncbi:MAG TPA: HD domain-containing phosphohydrolase [Candidatus Limnocylindria bacterium]|nr:HD domain-containing phosphohydrolase [Candidatus Limnocylindria bacterium]